MPGVIPATHPQLRPGRAYRLTFDGGYVHRNGRSWRQYPPPADEAAEWRQAKPVVTEVVVREVVQQDFGARAVQVIYATKTASRRRERAAVALILDIHPLPCKLATCYACGIGNLDSSG